MDRLFDTGYLGAATMIGTTVSHYKILEQLGGGGMGLVCRAEDLDPRRPLATEERTGS